MVNYGVDRTLVKVIEQAVAKLVTEKITAALEEGDLIKNVLALDVKNQHNQWQNLLV